MRSWCTSMEQPPFRPSLVGVLYAEDFDDDPLAAPVSAKAPAWRRATDMPAAEAGASRQEPAQGPAEPEAVEPTFTAAELDAARAEGREAGRVEAERGLAASRAAMVGLLASGLSEVQGSARGVAEAAAEGVARCLLSMMAACLPALCERHGAAELQALARAVLPALVDEPRITVRVHPYMQAAMQAEVAALDIELAERVQLLPTEMVAPGDARISWADGAVVRDAARARRAVEDALAALGLFDPTLLQPELA